MDPISKAIRDAFRLVHRRAMARGLSMNQVIVLAMLPSSVSMLKTATGMGPVNIRNQLDELRAKQLVAPFKPCGATELQWQRTMTGDDFFKPARQPDRGNSARHIGARSARYATTDGN